MRFFKEIYARIFSISYKRLVKIMSAKIFSLKTKIIILLSVLILFVTITLTIVYVHNLNQLVSSNTKLFSQTMMSSEKEDLQHKIDLASNILEMFYKKTTPKYMEAVVKKGLVLHQEQLFNQLNSIYNLYKNRETTQEIKKRLKNIVRYSHYGGNGYFWINDMNNKMIMHPIRPEYNNKTFINTPLVPFVELGVTALKKEKTDRTFIKYKFYNPTTKLYDFKVSLVRIFKPFHWVIGTGRYLSDVTPMIKQEALKSIEASRYGKSGYFWVNNMNYKMIMHPIKPEYDNKFFINSAKVPFVSLGVDALKKSKTGSAVIQYSFYNPATRMYENKLSIVKKFKPWNWVIGTGVYLNNMNHSLKKVKENKKIEEHKLIVKILMLSVIIILLVFVIAYYLITTFIINPMNSLTTEKKYFEEIAQIDYLTNILNRRAFYQEIDKYFSYAKRNELEISVMMIDIDFFKKVNDTYGHEAGDYILQMLTKGVKESIRNEDIFGRLGGEEFGICILNADAKSLCKIANKIRKNIENQEIIYQNKTIKITISIGGYNLFENRDDDFKIAFNKADKALYEAKETGRNKVVLFENSLTCEKN